MNPNATKPEGIRVGENIAGKNKQSPARISDLRAGHQGAIEAPIHYHFGDPYGYIRKK